MLTKICTFALYGAKALSGGSGRDSNPLPLLKGNIPFSKKNIQKGQKVPLWHGRRV